MSMEEKIMQEEDALVLVHLRNEFYKRKFHVALAVYAFSLVVAFILLSILIYIIKHPVHPLYFVTDSVGRLIEDVPLQKPNMSDDEATQYAKEVAEMAYSYDYVNYRGQLQEVQKYFTDYGWRNFLKGLTESNNLVALTQRKLISIAKVVEKPTLKSTRIIGGSYAWKFEMPMLVTYLLPPYDMNSDKSKFENPLKVTIVLQRQGILTSYKGIGVIQLIAELPTSAPSQNLNAPQP